MASGTKLVDTSVETGPDGATTRFTFFDPSEPVLRSLIDDLFLNHWSRIVFGPSYGGAIYEIHFQEAPQLSYSNGYLTADLGPWHFHLCLAPSKDADAGEYTSARAVARAALFERQSASRDVRSWGLRLWNGLGQQMITIWLPNPLLSDDRKQRLRTPDWGKLALYYELRGRLLGEPIPLDLAAAAQPALP